MTLPYRPFTRVNWVQFESRVRGKEDLRIELIEVSFLWGNKSRIFGSDQSRRKLMTAIYSGHDSALPSCRASVEQLELDFECIRSGVEYFRWEKF